MVVLWDTLEMVIHPRKDRSSLVHRVVFCCILRRGGCGGDPNDVLVAKHYFYGLSYHQETQS